jgi:hypothetical protein
VVLANAEEGEADLVGQHGLVDDVAQDLCLGERAAVGVGGDIAEGVQAELDVV